MATNTAEVLELNARPTPYDNDDRTWLEFRFKLENFLTLVDERSTWRVCKTQSFRRGERYNGD